MGSINELSADSWEVLRQALSAYKILYLKFCIFNLILDIEYKIDNRSEAELGVANFKHRIQNLNFRNDHRNHCEMFVSKFLDSFKVIHVCKH